MEQNINSNMNPIAESGNKKSSAVFIIIGIIIILAGLGVWYWQTQKSKIITPTAPSAAIPTAPLAVKEDSVAAVNQNLNSIDIGDTNKEFQAIDTDINSL